VDFAAKLCAAHAAFRLTPRRRATVGRRMGTAFLLD
jgi:hypothetical protein